MADKIYLKGTFAFREDTLANWKSYNPILEKGEPSIVRDGNETEWLKIGDGITPWNDLPWKKIASSGGSGDNITVDQTYNPESENAQSGKAVAQAIAGIGGSGGGGDVSNKMDKFGTVEKKSNSGQTIQLDTLTYLNDSNGQTVAMIGMSTDEVNINKNLGMMNKRIKNLGTPTDDTDAVNKNYVDTAIGSIDSALDSIIAIQNSILGGGA